MVFKKIELERENEEEKKESQHVIAVYVQCFLIKVYISHNNAPVESKLHVLIGLSVNVTCSFILPKNHFGHLVAIS